MSPESSEGRERIARLEGQVDDVERNVARNERTFGPLVLAVERLQWTVDAINSRLDKRDKEDEERFDKMTRSFENQITACSNQVAQVSEAMRQHHAAEQERREKQREQREQTSTQKFVARYGLITGLVVVLISSLTTIGLAIFGGG